MDSYHPRLRHDRDVFIFDLDQTLYPADCALFPQVEQRIGLYVQEFFCVGPQQASRYQKDLFTTYGTTLNGLMRRHGVAPRAFLDFVHDIDFSPIKRDDALRAALLALPGRRLIHTNADRSYAEKLLARLGIADLFEDIYDIIAADMRPKPDKAAYERLFDRYSVNPHRAMMVEDMARNLVPAHQCGMGTVWINTGSPWGAADHHPDAVHAEIDALMPWLVQYGRDRSRFYRYCDR